MLKKQNLEFRIRNTIAEKLELKAKSHKSKFKSFFRHRFTQINADFWDLSGGEWTIQFIPGSPGPWVLIIFWKKLIFEHVKQFVQLK